MGIRSWRPAAELRQEVGVVRAAEVSGDTDGLEKEAVSSVIVRKCRRRPVRAAVSGS